MKHKGLIIPLALLGFGLPAAAAEETDTTATLTGTYLGREVIAQRMYEKKPSWWDGVRATGSVQANFLVPQNDAAIGADPVTDKVLNDTYVDLTVNAPYVSVGGRFEFNKYPLPGYDPGFKGWGVPYLWATGRYKWAQLTVGDYYEQFGSGFILRTYQERTLGIDNALRGGRLKLNPANGLYLTALAGRQRAYWDWNKAWIWGGNADWTLDESFANAFGSDYGMTLGFSYVGKYDNSDYYQPTNDDQYRLVFPKKVAAFDGRVNLRLKDFTVLAEYATKNNDPSVKDGFLYRRGSAALLSVTYASNGLSAFIQAKRSEDMPYRSDALDNSSFTSFINHLPAFTNTQTYTLAAMYPYVTQYDGEWAFQAEIGYKFKKKTPLGGKYGTEVRASASYISALCPEVPAGEPKTPPYGSSGYKTPFFKIGSLNYADLNIEIKKKFSRVIDLSVFYLFQKFNEEVVLGHHGTAVVNTFIHEGKWRMSRKCQLRWEAQYLHTKQDKGDWVAALAEFSFAPHWMFTLSDTYNLSKTEANDFKRLNYYEALVTYNYRANRFTLGYGRIRGGYNCSGGVCRWVPPYRGFSLTYNYTF